MHEDFLHYLWYSQKFDQNNLKTSQGERLKILDPGTSNKHAGPDFLNAAVRINGLAWHGHVEIHIYASDWYRHHHHEDPAYKNVILHVVWRNNRIVHGIANIALPTLVLQRSTPLRLIQQYKRTQNHTGAMNHSTAWKFASNITKRAMLDMGLFRRLDDKQKHVQMLWQRNKDDSQETAYQLLAFNFGFKVNSDAFLDLSLCTPLRLLWHHHNNLPELEALLFGQAGLITEHGSDKTDPYRNHLAQLYTRFKKQYGLQTHLTKAQWKFFRLRPANFPTIRIAQFAQLLYKYRSLLHLLLYTPTEELYQKLTICQSAYWCQHYQFGKASKKPIPGLGKASIHNIYINTVVPLLIAYGKQKNAPHYTDSAIEMLQSLPAEHNSITRHWQATGFTISNAFDSQASIALFNLLYNRVYPSCDSNKPRGYKQTAKQ